MPARTGTPKMSTNIEQAKAALYGSDSLRVTNLKLFPGTNRDVTAEQIAEQINAVVLALKNAPDQDTELVKLG